MARNRACDFVIANIIYALKFWAASSLITYKFAAAIFTACGSAVVIEFGQI